MHEGKLRLGSIEDAAKKFDIGREAVSRLWNNSTTTRLQQYPDWNEILSKKNERGRKPLYDREAVKEACKEVARKKRKTIRALASSIDIPRSTIHRMKALDKIFVRHTSSLKPVLTDNHKLARIDYCLSMRDKGDPTRFADMYDMVHVDEKWFYITSDGEAYILAEGEEPPVRRTMSKQYITKVMFLCAQARPRKINGVMWNGKIGLWPIGHTSEAKRRSKNKNKGDPVWVNDSVTKDVYREYMITKVLPAILAVFPVDYLDRKGVRIQQDGAKSHIADDDEEWLEALEELAPGNKIKLFTQPARSPDLNINDLAFFRSIQSLYYEAAPDTEFELIEAVEAAFEEYPANKINRMWLTHQSCMNEILECHGDNTYTIPHMNKERLEREGRLPKVLQVTDYATTFDEPENT
jgi:hypothetical protein